VVHDLGRTLDQHALVFYNEFCPQVVAALLRPSSEIPFSALHSEQCRPTSGDLVETNVSDLVREIRHCTDHVVVNVKVLVEEPNKKRRREAEETSGDNE
jgi:hypothetical protein